MQQLTGALDDQMRLQARLRRFMNWFLAAFTTLALLMTIALLRLPARPLNGLLGTASIYGLLVILLVARFPLSRRPVAAGNHPQMSARRRLAAECSHRNRINQGDFYAQ
jgi:hypothetical protein